MTPPSWRWYFNTSPSTRGFAEHVAGLLPQAISIPAPPRGASATATPATGTPAFQYQPLHEGLPTLTSSPARPTNFNTSPSTRGFHPVRDRPQRQQDFNTSPSTRGFRLTAAAIRASLFQYQPLHEGLRPGFYCFHRRHDFNTSPSTRGFGAMKHGAERGAFQYQPLHEGLLSDPGRLRIGEISIPAPPRGASGSSSTICP